MTDKSHPAIVSLRNAGIEIEDAIELRRISMTLHRWHELECGDGNDYASWTITRGFKPKRDAMGARLDGGPNEETFIYDDNGTPFEERHVHTENKARYTPIADKERGALKRLDAIMKRYPGFVSYVQGDPRGCSLYILRPEDVASLPDGVNGDVGSIYTRGIAVCK